MSVNSVFSTDYSFNYDLLCNDYLDEDSKKFTHFYRYDPQTRQGKIIERTISCVYTYRLLDCARRTASVDEEGNEITGEYQIEFVDEMDFIGMCDCRRRKIKILSSLRDEDAFSVFVFELTNAISCKKYELIRDMVIRGELDEEGYACAFEYIEFYGEHFHYATMCHAAVVMGWSLRFLHTVEFTDFETHWKVRRETPHAEFYRKSYREMVAQIKGQIDAIPSPYEENKELLAQVDVFIAQAEEAGPLEWSEADFYPIKRDF